MNLTAVSILKSGIKKVSEKSRVSSDVVHAKSVLKGETKLFFRLSKDAFNRLQGDVKGFDINKDETGRILFCVTDAEKAKYLRPIRVGKASKAKSFTSKELSNMVEQPSEGKNIPFILTEIEVPVGIPYSALFVLSPKTVVVATDSLGTPVGDVNSHIELSDYDNDMDELEPTDVELEEEEVEEEL